MRRLRRLEAQLASAHSELATARAAQAKYAASYGTIVHLGKAVPTTQEVPSLMYELAQASKKKSVEFASITASTDAKTASSLSHSAAASAGFQQMPFTFEFNGTYFGLEEMLRKLTNFATKTSTGAIKVNGRLLTIQGVTSTPVSVQGRIQDEPAPDRDGNGERLHAPPERPRPARGRGRATTAPHRAAGRRRHRPPHLPSPRRKAMNIVKDYLHALEEDLRDRRMLPFVALAGVAMLGAIVFVILGGSARRRGPLDPIGERFGETHRQRNGGICR